MSNVHLDAKKKRRISQKNQQEERMEDEKQDQAQAKKVKKGDLTSAIRTSHRKHHRQPQSKEPRARSHSKLRQAHEQQRPSSAA
jgi:hypothetical protein